MIYFSLVAQCVFIVAAMLLSSHCKWGAVVCFLLAGAFTLYNMHWSAKAIVAQRRNK